MFGRVNVYGNAASVVLYAANVVFFQSDRDCVAKTGHRFVDGVVNDFVNQVVKAVWSGGTNVHARALSDSFQSFKDLNVAS